MYLLHTNPNIFSPFFKPTIKAITESSSGIITLIEIFAFLIALFIIAIVLDQPRKFLWRKLARMIDVRFSDIKTINN